MSRVAIGLLFVVIFTTGVALAGGEIHGLAATSLSGKIVISWVSDDETGVTGYIIERKAGMDGPFIRLTDPPIHPLGSNSSYTFEDNTAFRTTGTFYQYRITAVGTTNVYYVSVSHDNLSGVRRTWGSIKAMFR
jgi:hypothetical protein